MNNAKTIVDELRKRGLSNGGSLGYHSGLMNEAADVIESQQAEIEKLQTMLGAKINANFALTVLRSHREEGVKEFAEKLKARNKVYCCNEADLKEMNLVIDNLVKEVIEVKE